MNGTETVGIWINKRSLENFELPFRHNLQSKDAGWQIEVLEEGRLTLRFQSGRQINYDVEKGDLIFSNGEEIYLTLQRSTKTTAAGTKSQRQAASAESSATSTQAADTARKQ